MICPKGHLIKRQENTPHQKEKIIERTKFLSAWDARKEDPTPYEEGTNALVMIVAGKE